MVKDFLRSAAPIRLIINDTRFLRPVCRTTPANRYQNVAPFWILLQQRVGDGGDDDNGNSITLL